MEEALRALLAADAGVTALVPAAGINWRRHPQNMALPGIVLRVISDRDTYTVSDTTDHSEARVQIDAWALSYPQAKAIARAVRACLGGHRDATLVRVHLLGARDMPDPEATDDRTGVSMDFAIDYRRT